MVFYFSAFRCRNLYVKEIMLFGVVLRLLNGAMLLGRLCHQNLLNIYFNFRPNKVQFFFKSLFVRTWTSTLELEFVGFRLGLRGFTYVTEIYLYLHNSGCDISCLVVFNCRRTRAELKCLVNTLAGAKTPSSVLF